MLSPYVGGKRQMGRTLWLVLSCWFRWGQTTATIQMSSTSPLFEPVLGGGGREGPAEPLESFIFDRTGQEKGQAPGRQINLMKFVIDCGNINLVITSGISHKKLLITAPLLAPSFHFLLYGGRGGNHSNCTSLLRIQRLLFFLRFHKALEGQTSGPVTVTGRPEGSQCSELCPMRVGGGVSCAKCLLPRAPCTQCSAPECSC